MTSILVAQTHEGDRIALCDFLKVSGYDPKPFSTDAISLTFLSREMMFAAKPTVIVTSQRDAYGCGYLSNLVHAVALNMGAPTLTIVYSRAVAHQEHLQGVALYIADLVSTSRHQLKFVPKDAQDTVEQEHQLVLGYIQNFERT